MNKDMETIEIIWRKGERGDRSLKTDNPNNENKNAEIADKSNNASSESNNVNEIKKAGTISLTLPPIVNGIHNSLLPDNSLFKNNTNIKNNKKEIFNDKLNSRHMVGLMDKNPFMVNNKYIDDLVNQNTFLRPQSSNKDD
jgi:hypothetical protein